MTQPFLSTSQLFGNLENPGNINAEMDKINQWLQANKLTLNDGKTIFMVSKTRPMKNTSRPLRLMINGKEIERVSNFLGTIFNGISNWLVNTYYKNGKAISQVIGALNKIKRFLPMRILKMLYKSLILPKLHYGLFFMELQR